MKGHENIIKVRMAGKRPTGSVFVLDFPVERRLTEWSHAEDPQRPMVSTDGDTVGSLDLRFLVGLGVILVGEDTGRIKSLCAALVKAGAASIFASAGENYAFWKKGGKWQTF